MEQLPPLAHNWQMMPNSAAAAAAPWMDDFLDFSATRRSLHRRTVSDPIAFAEDPPNNNTLFDRLDDDQLHDMFSNVAAVGSSSDPPSDQNSDNDDKITAPHIRPKTEPEPAPDAAPQPISSDDNIADPKRIKRILANRQSAQRSRVRKLHYISELERSVTTLQTEVSALSPRVAFLDHQRLMLSVDNSAIKQRIAALAQDRIFKDAHQEALKKEIERLREIYHKQNMRKTMENQGRDNAPPFTEEE